MKNKNPKNTEIEETLLELFEQGFRVVEIERCLGLNNYDLKKANATNNPEAIALMRMIRSFPWILRVAERGFDETYAKETLKLEALKMLAKNKKI